MKPNFKLYKEGQKNPFNPESEPEMSLFWEMEQRIAEEPYMLDSVYNNTLPSEYPEWLKGRELLPNDIAMLLTMASDYDKFMNGQGENIDWEKYITL